jgi:hypothetical protein
MRQQKASCKNHLMRMPAHFWVHNSLAWRFTCQGAVRTRADGGPIFIVIFRTAATDMLEGRMSW